MLKTRRSLLLCLAGVSGAPVVLRVAFVALLPRVAPLPPHAPEDLPLAVPLDFPAAAALRR